MLRLFKQEVKEEDAAAQAFWNSGFPKVKAEPKEPDDEDEDEPVSLLLPCPGKVLIAVGVEVSE